MAAKEEPAFIQAAFRTNACPNDGRPKAQRGIFAPDGESMEGIPTCSICLEELGTIPEVPLEEECPSTVAGLKGCGHLFHSGCILLNLRIHNTCPNCRHPVKGPARGRCSIFFVPKISYEEPIGVIDGRSVDVSKEANGQTSTIEHVLEKCRVLSTRLCESERLLNESKKEVQLLNKAKDDAEAHAEQLQETIKLRDRALQRERKHMEECDRQTRQEADIKIQEIKRQCDSRVDEISAYCRTLESNLRRAELIALPHTSDDFTPAFTQAIEHLTEMSDFKLALYSYHRKLETCKKSLQQWKDRATSLLKSSKERKSELAAAREMLQDKTAQLARLQETHDMVQKDIRSREQELENKIVELGNMKTRYLAAQEEIIILKGQLVEWNRQEIAVNDFTPSTHGSSVKGSWDKVGAAFMQRSDATGKKRTTTEVRDTNPFAAIAVAETSTIKARGKRPSDHCRDMQMEDGNKRQPSDPPAPNDDRAEPALTKKRKTVKQEQQSFMKQFFKGTVT
ncbi:uncharacterized protein SPPG_04322 [Spizellomyces punctatus DAOM BR117]|uniref:RING-type domain-containing protein n=1 Tax=Spizellomyces punctatus (strain DAOM BR117) TaxID=645134 RepID=A0A0L0HIG1_SPIPD|nr:uncharacterized protein SPPG_04322 [Spizellomyces punctatus DAOM BR117]KND01231.1 hypothetical protein SPPG_04322 [Spizellomyces punctatus DAOM BR117]|eukprot:XP_016609270.1 hypothetical protein SPPG_04322 [Spizellomyces punctatus DAOM BR117]